ncbi:MAG: hypothetical protein L0191_06640 [Acidobacteria bacterium]|nr:hypothetical protein [Acidobacteriota bacterium]MCI0568002.1 hypothetical protein [Acidobacteriota bacterium]
MKMSIGSAILAGLLLGAVPGGLPPSTHTDDLLDSPGGHPIAILLPGTARRVVETRDGYVKVVVEGWVRQEGAPAILEVPPPASPSPPPEPVSLSGRIEIRLPTKEIRYGAGAHVTLLGNLTELEPRRAVLATAYQSEVRDLEAQIAQLETAKRQALNSSDNLTQASKKLDQAKASLARKSQELGAIQKKYGTLGDALAEEFKVAEVSADPGGEYHLYGVAPGEYRLRAWFSDQGSEYRWYLPASVSAQKSTVLDLGAAKVGQDPFLQSP